MAELSLITRILVFGLIHDSRFVVVTSHGSLSAGSHGGAAATRLGISERGSARFPIGNTPKSQMSRSSSHIFTHTHS